MTSFPADPMCRYNSHTYKAIIKGLKSGEQKQKEALEVLSEMLVFAEPAMLANFPGQDICKLLMNLLTNSNNSDLLILVTQSLATLLHIHSNALHWINGSRLITLVLAKMKTTISVPLLENMIHILAFFAKNASQPFAENFGIALFLEVFPKVSKVEQRECISCVAAITQACVLDKFGQLIPQLLTLMSHEDHTVRVQARNAIRYIMVRIPMNAVPRQALTQIFAMLETTNDQYLAIVIAGLLKRAAKDRNGLKVLTESPPNFERLLFSPMATDIKDVCKDILNTLAVLMPTPTTLPKLIWKWKSRQSPNGEDYVRNVMSMVIKFLLERSQCEKTAFAILAGCVSMVPLPVNNDIWSLLLRGASSSKMAPAVLSIALSLSSNDKVVRSGLLHLLKKASVDAGLRDWYKDKLTRLKSAVPLKEIAAAPSFVAFSQTLQPIIEYIQKCDMLPYEFLKTKLIDKCASIIGALETVEICDEDLMLLLDLAYGVIDFVPVPKIVRFRFDSFGTVGRKTVTLRVVGPKIGTCTHSSFILVDTFLALEAWYNTKINPKLVSDLEARISHNALKRLVKTEGQLKDNPVKVALFCRAFNLPSYIRCSFKIGKNVFSAYDDLIRALSSLHPDASKLSFDQIDIEILEKEERRSAFIIFPFESHTLGKAVKFIQVLRSKFCDRISSRSIFSSQRLKKAISPMAATTRYAPVMRMYYQYPSLFSYDDRLFIFQITAFPPDYAIQVIHDKLYPDADVMRNATQKISCTVSRSSLFEDASLLLRALGSGPTRLEVMFEGEMGFGEGPTQEFFTLVSREFCRSSRNLWRTDSDGEYAFHPNGLFPTPTANCEMFQLLGTLCSKAMLCEKVLDIPFNPAFFKIAMGLPVTLEEVDPVLARSLTCKEGLYGLDFTYPGIPTLEMVDGAADKIVDSSNVDGYVKLVTDFTIGTSIIQSVKAFLRGFEKNLQFGTLAIFSPQEVVNMLSGQGVNFTIVDLRANVRVEHGYELASREVEMFFQVLQDLPKDEQVMALKFITGSTRLPVGGLKALRPKLTIARRVSDRHIRDDDCLPSVMTCTNYLKLPAYSSIEIMRQKLLIAIHECQDTFLLS